MEGIEVPKNRAFRVDYISLVLGGLYLRDSLTQGSHICER